MREGIYNTTIRGLLGFISLIPVYLIIYDPRLALIATACYLTTVAFFLYFKNINIGISKNLLNHTAVLILFLLIIISGFQGIIIKNNLNNFDDIFLLIGVGIFVIKFVKNGYVVREKFNIITSLYLMLLVMMLSILINGVPIQYGLMQLYIYMKVPMILVLMLSIEIEDKYIFLKRIYNFVYIIAIINLLVGFSQFIYFRYTGQFILGEITIPSMSIRNNDLRINGLTGHQLNLAFLLLFVLCYETAMKKGILRKGMYGLLFVGLILTGSRLALMGYLLFLFFKYVPIHKKMWVVYIPLFGMLFMLIFNWSFLQEDIDNSIRITGLVKGVEIALDNPLFGAGVGNYGGQASIVGKSKIYDEYNFSYNYLGLLNERQSSGIETFLGQIIGESGIIGTVSFYMIFILLIWRLSYGLKNIKEKKSYIVPSFYLLIVFVISTIFNPIYTIPFSVLVIIFCCALLFGKNKTTL